MGTVGRNNGGRMNNAAAIVSANDQVRGDAERSLTIIQLIERAAQNPSVDLDKMERLIELQQRVLDRNAALAFNAALQAVQAELPQVVRDARNPQTNSRYARLETISKAMNPIVTKHGFSLSFGTEVSPAADHYRVTCELAHIGGHSRSYHADIPVDGTGMKGAPNKTATHAFGSTLSYGRRYLKLLIFDVATADDDDGNAAAGQNPITGRQAKTLTVLIDEVVAELGTNRERYVRNFLGYMQADSIATLAAGDYERAVDAINSTRRPS
jgi:ERF superfamily